MKSRRSPALTARWNKDLSITLYCDGRKLERFNRRHDPREAAATWMTGWFGTADKKAWRVRWVYA